MAKLINVIKEGEGELSKRQLPLFIDEKLTMVLDLIDVDFMCEYPKIRGKEKEIFVRKFNTLNVQELKDAFQVDCKRLLDTVSEIVPCVGCRRSVERLFRQMKSGPGRSALYPLEVTSDGVVILPEEVFKWPNVIGAMFHNHVSKLNDLSTSWSRLKKSSRCTLHSLDTQRYVRPPLGSGWRDLWECMVPFCKQEVATIDTSQLLNTLETYLQKHRFCIDCRTKVMKAYSLLVNEPGDRKGDCISETGTTSTSCELENKENIQCDDNGNCGSAMKEKVFIPSLYAGIRRCSPNNHIHVDQRTDYIMWLILAAEPELLGNRRDRHAKTLENAQEEVLVCVGLCLYERVHRIQLRLREIQTTCQLLALVAINALSTSFQLAVEVKQGISQLELLFEEFSREDKLKQRRKQVRKLKKRRKKERKNAATVHDSLPEAVYSGPDNAEEEKNDSGDAEEPEIIKHLVSRNKIKLQGEENNCNIKPFFRMNDGTIVKLPRKNIILEEGLCNCSKFVVSTHNSKDYKQNKLSTVDSRSCLLDKSKRVISSSVFGQARNCKLAVCKSGSKIEVKSTNLCRSVNDFSDTNNTNSASNSSSSSCIYSRFKECPSSNFKKNKVQSFTPDVETTCECCDSIQNDCGYGSADNNIMSSNGSGESSVESSEVACSEGFCNHDGSEECGFDVRHSGSSESGGNVKQKSPKCDQTGNSMAVIDSANQSLQQMLTETFAVDKDQNVDQRITECTIPVEEIQRYKSSMGRINEKREQLRKILRTKFAQLCLQQQKPEALSTV